MEVLQETGKPFKLVKYFFLSSFIVMLIFAISLTVIITQRSKATLLKKTETFALLLAENLNHQVFFSFVLPIALQRKEVRLRNPEQFKQLDIIVQNTIYSFKIEKVNMYDPLNVIAYSTDQTLLGKKGVGGTDYKKAMIGQFTSRFISEDSFWPPWPGGVTPSRKLITTIPFRVEPITKASSQILGVFEITQDISKDYEDLVRDQYLIVLISVGLMALLYLIILFIVKQGELIMKRRAEEQKRLVGKLHQAERMATLGEMIASVSHEIKNPLGIIRSTADLLEKKVVQYDPQNQLASVIREEADRLNRIVSEFLDFARPQTPRFQPGQIEAVLRKNIQFLDLELQRRSVTVEEDFIPDPESVPVDQDLLYRAFLNILLNAIQAMPEGGKIKMKVRHDPRKAEIEIADSGPGLAKEELTKVFKPFYTTKEKGSGLGLAIVKNIIEAHGGTIEVANSPVGGTAVLIALPKGGRLESK